MITDIQTFFFNQGILGIIILILGFVIVWLVKRLDKKDDDIKKQNETINNLQEKRTLDIKQVIESFMALGGDLKNGQGAISTAIESIAKAVDVIRDGGAK